MKSEAWNVGWLVNREPCPLAQLSLHHQSGPAPTEPPRSAFCSNHRDRRELLSLKWAVCPCPGCRPVSVSDHMDNVNKGHDGILRTGPSSPPRCSEKLILSIKITNRLRDKGQPERNQVFMRGLYDPRLSCIRFSVSECKYVP